MPKQLIDGRLVSVAAAPRKRRSRARSRGANTTGVAVDPKQAHASVTYFDDDGMHKASVPFSGGTWAAARKAVRSALPGAKIEWDTLQIG